jgi:hypothetical protein
MNLIEHHHRRLRVWVWVTENGKTVAKYRKISTLGGLLTFRDRSPFMSRPLGLGKLRPTHAKHVLTIAEARKIVGEITRDTT